MGVRAHCDFRGWRRLYLDVGVFHCYESKGPFILLFCLDNICSGCLMQQSLPSTNSSVSNASPFSKTWGKLTFFPFPWPVAYFNCMATTFAVWVGANKLGICSLFWGCSIECHTILAHFWRPISANPSIPVMNRLDPIEELYDMYSEKENTPRIVELVNDGLDFVSDTEGPTDPYTDL